MIQHFITDITTLKQTVKINNNTSLFASLLPYFDDAYVKYIRPYLGDKLAASLKDTDPLFRYVQRALGPLTVALASPELGVLIGDSGHTVTNNDKFVVASDNKIMRSEESMKERGWANLDEMIRYLSEHEIDYPEWAECSYCKRKAKGYYLNNAEEFQDKGFVNIGYSALAFENLRLMIDAMQHKVSVMIGKDLDNRLRESLTGLPSALYAPLIDNIRIWIASNIAKVYTSQTTRVQRTVPGTVEFRPVIYPLYADPADNGNFYEEQASSAEVAIRDYMLINAIELGIDAPIAFDFNKPENKIFIA